MNRKLLMSLVRGTKLIILNKIRTLTEACSLLDQIELSIDEPVDDEYLKHLVATQLLNRGNLVKTFESFDQDERALWNSMLHYSDEEEP